MPRTIAQIIYDIEEMYNNIADYPEEYSYDRHVVPLKLELAEKTYGVYIQLDVLDGAEVELLLLNEFGLRED